MRLFRILILTIIIVACFTTVATAKDKILENDKVLYSTPEITDFDTILDRAKKGISDNKSVKAEWEGSNDLNVMTFSTTQKIKETQKADGNKMTEYVTNAIYYVQSPGSQGPEEKFDPKTYGVSGLVKIFWYAITPDGYPTSYQIYRSEVTFKQYDSSIVLAPNSTYIKAKAEGNCYFPPNFTSPGTCNKSAQRFYPGAVFNTTYSCDVRYDSSDWPWPAIHTTGGRIVASAKTTLKRNTTTWTFEPLMSIGTIPY